MATPSQIQVLPLYAMVGVHQNATIASSGSFVVNGLVGTRELDLTLNVKAAPTGTAPTLAFTLTEVDPGDQVTPIGTTVVGATLSAAGTQQLQLPNTTTGCVLVSWTLGGTVNPTFTQVYATLASKPTESVQEQLAPVYEDNVAGRAVVENRYSPFRQSGVTAGIGIKTGPGFLHALNISNITATAAVTLYDNTSAAGTIIWASGAISAGNPFPVPLDVTFANGLFLVVATAACDVVASYR